MILRPSALFTPALLALLSSPAIAQLSLLEGLSFGQKTPLSKDGTNIPSFSLTGADDHSPNIFSDRIQLTPPYPGVKRGAIWANSPVNAQSWDLTAEFRASGPERGAGNLQLWLVKDKRQDVQLASVYSVDKFDGLGIVLDQYGGQGGSVRGFLNDGTTSFRQRNIDPLAFGHCSYAYRNLGRMSKLRVIQNQSGFEVRLDDKTCFKSEAMQLPTGYYFGISAASAENPDAFEIAKFMVSQGSESTGGQQQQQQQQAQQPIRRDPVNTPPPQFQQPKDSHSDATYQQSMAEFFTLVQGLNTKVDSLVGQVQSLDRKQLEVKGGGGGGGGSSLPTDQLNAMAQRMEHVEKMVEEVKKDIEGKDYMDHLQNLHDTLEETQRYLGSGLSENMTRSEFTH